MKCKYHKVLRNPHREASAYPYPKLGPKSCRWVKLSCTYLARKPPAPITPSPLFGSKSGKHPRLFTPHYFIGNASHRVCDNSDDGVGTRWIIIYAVEIMFHRSHLTEQMKPETNGQTHKLPLYFSPSLVQRL